MIPREHGAWMMLYVSFLMGVGEGEERNLGTLGMLLFISGGYCLREPLNVWFTRKGRRNETLPWAIAFAGLMALGAGGLAFHERRKELATWTLMGGVLFSVHFVLARRREHRGFFGELLGIAGLTLTAPMGYFAAEGTEQNEAILLWLLNFFYFGSSVPYVKWRVAQLTAERRGIPTREGIGALITYHGVFLVVLGGLIAFGRIPARTFVAFAPLAFRYGLRALVRRTPTLTQVGISEIVFSLTFLAAMLWAV